MPVSAACWVAAQLTTAIISSDVILVTPCVINYAWESSPSLHPMLQVFVRFTKLDAEVHLVQPHLLEMLSAERAKTLVRAPKQVCETRSVQVHLLMQAHKRAVQSGEISQVHSRVSTTACQR